jgi:hypothetical protein
MPRHWTLRLLASLLGGAAALIGCGPAKPTEAELIGTWAVAPESVAAVPDNDETSPPQADAHFELLPDGKARLVRYPNWPETRRFGNTLNTENGTWWLKRGDRGWLLWIKVPPQGGYWLSRSFAMEVARDRQSMYVDTSPGYRLVFRKR